MTIKEALKKTKEKLEKSGTKNSQLESEMILSFITKLSREKLLSHKDQKIKNKRKLEKITNKRTEFYPLAYLTRSKSFYNLDFIVNEKVLIPRPESELIIDHILKNFPEDKEMSIIDIGTGSGCLILSLADLWREKENINYYGIDISSSALKIAKKNAKKHQLKEKITFLKGNLLSPILKEGKKLKKEIVIIANLPYLKKEEIKESPSIKFEPKKALDGGPNGLKHYRKLLEEVKKIKNKNITIYKEINDWQAKELTEIIEKKIGSYNPKVDIIKDLAGHKRLIVSKITKAKK
jgi:release factor glutamine methyltransferase